MRYKLGTLKSTSAIQFRALTATILVSCSIGCHSHDSKQTQLRAQAAADFESKLCGQRVSDSCKVADLETESGPILAVKYFRANDEFSLPLARDGEWTRSLASQGFKFLVIGNGLYYQRTWPLSMSGAPERPAPIQLTQEEMALMNELSSLILNETGTKVTSTISSRTPLTVEISSPEMTGGVVAKITSDYPVMQKLLTHEIAQLAFRDRSTLLRQIAVPSALTGMSNALSQLTQEELESVSAQDTCSRYFVPSSWKTIKRRAITASSECQSVEMVVEAPVEKVVAQYQKSFPFLERTNDTTGDDGTRMVILDGYSRGNLKIWFYAYGPQYERTQIEVFVG